MARLHQIIPLEATAKNKSHEVLGKVHHNLKRTAQLAGLTRTYQPKDDEGDQLPSESTRVQIKGTEQLALATNAVTKLLSLSLTKEMANQNAMADIEVGGEIILGDVPVTYLLSLEKQLTDLRTFFRALPALDPAETWTWDATSATYRTPVSETVRSKKVPKAFVKYEATTEHPAQVDVFTEDVIDGTWSLTRFSGAFPQAQIDEYVERVEALLEAVKVARSKANETEAPKQDASPLLEYILS